MTRWLTFFAPEAMPPITAVRQLPVTEQQLSTIVFKNGKVVFELAPTAREDIAGTAPKSLQDIKIYNHVPATGGYSLLKTIWFYQNYFINSADGAKRLRLDAIAVMDENGVKIHV
jgi:hypothetical protein